MMIDIIPLISFVFVTTFTPGPNNISSASMGIVFGYRKTLGYLLGIVTGFFLVMMICAVFSGIVLKAMPFAEKYLRLVGAVYISWLAVGIIRTSYDNLEGKASLRAFSKGFFLQWVNPKAFVYALTLFSTFLAPLSGRYFSLLIIGVCLSIVTFSAVSTWALAGSFIKDKLKKPAFAVSVNIVLALMLIYSAVELSGLM